MTLVGVPLGLLASLSMVASFCCHMMAASPAGQHHRHGEERPKKAPDPPAGCHAVLGCAAHRKLRTFP
jgi:hypothetical protein